MSLNKITFKEKSDSIHELELNAKNGTVGAVELLQRFYAELDEMAMHSDIAPMTRSAYEHIVVNLPYDVAQESLEYMFKNHDMVILNSSHILFCVTKQYPEMTMWVFDKLMQKLHIANDAMKSKIIPIMVKIILNAPDKNKMQLIDALLDRLNRVDFDVLFVEIGVLYNSIPESRDKIFDAIVDYYDANTFDGLKGLFLALFYPTPLPPRVLNLIERNLNNPNLNNSIIELMIEIAGRFINDEQHGEYAKDILNKIRQNKHAKKIDTLRSVARKLGDRPDLLRSFAFFGQRVPKTPENEYGWVRVAAIAPNEKCVLMLGGNSVFNDSEANGYLKEIEELFQSVGISGVNLYSIVCDFGNPYDKKYFFNDKNARNVQMTKYGHKMKGEYDTEEITLSYDDVNPQYVQQIFNCIFLPRIADNGKKIDVGNACRNIRNITVVAHCHGAYTFIALEEMMQNKLTELGYTNAERAQIQKQLVCIANAPYCPLGVSKSTMISFMSAKDYRIHGNNLFEKALFAIDVKRLAYFPDKRGNLFMCPELTTHDCIDWDDHSFFCYNYKSEFLTPTGKIMTHFAANALINSVSDKPITSTKDLVTNGDIELLEQFKSARDYGDEIYKQIVALAMIESRIMHPEK